MLAEIDNSTDLDAWWFAREYPTDDLTKGQGPKMLRRGPAFVAIPAQYWLESPFKLRLR